MAYIYTGCTEIETGTRPDGWMTLRILDRDHKKEIDICLTPAEAGRLAQAMLDDAASLMAKEEDS